MQVTQDLISVFAAIAVIAAGVLLCLAGDWIRRWTGGRVRHAEIHLLAWAPPLTIGCALAYVAPISRATMAIPLAWMALVYLYFLLDHRSHPRAWARSEQRLDEVDELHRQQRRRRRAGRGR